MRNGMTFTGEIFAYCLRLWFLVQFAFFSVFVCGFWGSALTSYCQIYWASTGGQHHMQISIFLFSCLQLTFFPFCGFLFTATFRSYNAHFVAQLFESFWTRPSCLLSFALALLLLTGILSAVIIILVLLLIRRTHFYFGFHSHFHWLRHCQPKTLQLLLLPRYLWIRTDRWDSHIISLGSEIVTHFRCWYFPKQQRTEMPVILLECVLDNRGIWAKIWLPYLLKILF